METLNKETLLNLIRLYGPISRTALSERIKISTAAITKYISELLSEGIVLETGTDISLSGRKPILLNINPSYGYIIGIDFGQMFFRIAVFNLNNEIVYKQIIPSEDLGEGTEGIHNIKCIVEAAIKRVPQGGKFLAIGLSISAAVEYGKNISFMLPAMKGWNNVDFEALFLNSFNVPVYIDDSSHLMALCESSIPGKGRLGNLIFVNIGAGVGTGIIIWGRIFKGAMGLAGELGHIIVEKGGLPCGCGNRGCLEQYVSVESMLANAKCALRDGVRSSILAYAEGDIEKVSSYSIAKACLERDKLAFGILVDAGNHLGIGLSHLVNLFNPDTIIIGGGGTEISEVLVDEAVKTLQLKAFSNSIRDIKVQKSKKGEDCALIGASIFAQDNFFGLNKLQENRLF